MRTESVARWACPRDGHSPLDLTIIKVTDDQIVEGNLSCAQCGSIFLIRDGLANFLYLEEDKVASIKRAEMEARNRDIDVPDDLLEKYEAELESEAVLARLNLSARDRVLDAGCGYGRITRRVLESGADVVAVDFSPVHLKFLRDHMRAAHSFDLAIAELNHLPFVPGTFTKILSTQVLEHLPTAKLRRAFIGRLLDLLAPGGALVLTVYNYDAGKQRFGEPKEGFHDSGIFYHCYDAAELRAEMNGGQVQEICGICHHLRGTYKLKLFPRLGSLGCWFDHMLEKIPAVSLRYGSLLLARVVK